MYLVFDGPDCVGKSTQVRLLKQRLEASGQKVVITKEPGSEWDPVCQQIRSLILDPNNKIERRAALFLFLADRAQHIEFVRKKLYFGYTVISDRSSISTWVYYMAEFKPELMDMEDWVCNSIDRAQQIAPDLGFICNAPFEWRKEKLAKRLNMDRIEQFDDAFHIRVGELFADAENLRGKMHLLPRELKLLPPTSSCSVEEMSELIWDIVNGNSGNQ